MSHIPPSALIQTRTPSMVPGGFDTESFFGGAAGLFEVRLGQNGWMTKHCWPWPHKCAGRDGAWSVMFRSKAMRWASVIAARCI